MVVDVLLPDLMQVRASIIEAYDPFREAYLRQTCYLPYEQLCWFREPQKSKVPPGLIFCRVPFTRSFGPRRPAKEIWRDSQIILHELIFELMMSTGQSREERIYLPTEECDR